MSLTDNAFAGVDWNALGVPNPNATTPTPPAAPAAPQQPGPTTTQSVGPDASMMQLAQMLAQNKQPTGYYDQVSTPHTQNYLGVIQGQNPGYVPPPPAAPAPQADNPWRSGRDGRGGRFEDWMARRQARRSERHNQGMQGYMAQRPEMDNPALQEFLRRRNMANPFGGLNQ